MKAFRIGRKPAGPWPNMTPPIRGGIYRSLDARDEDDGERCSSSSGSMPTDPVDQQGRRRTPTAAAAAGPDSPAPKQASGGKAPRPTTCPDEYADWAVQQGVDECHRAYPCADDAALQQSIVRRYRQLHQQVKDEGLYECRYVEYGKEMIRYVSLFGMFLFTLRHEWYMTSAVFLGLFWVSRQSSIRLSIHCSTQSHKVVTVRGDDRW